ncbi:hypothetical protein FQN52_007198 [Onygenales sp. PD_12]|nr:hypothetical protein FQN52_007198 [Onygenales sp. PD_12]
MPPMRLINVLVASDNPDSAFALTMQYTLNHFVDRPYEPFIGEDYRKQVVIDDRVSLLHIESQLPLDMEYYSAVYDLFLKQTNVCIFMYDVAANDPQDGLNYISRLYGRAAKWDRNKFLGTTGYTQKPAKEQRFSSTSIPQASGMLQDLSKRVRPKISLRVGPLASVSERRRPRLQNTFTPFPRLPAELQIAVLRACVTSSHPIALYKNPDANGINMNVLLACKFFYEEGIKIFHVANTFISPNPSYIVADTTWIPTSYPMAQQHCDAIEKGRDLANQLGCKFMQSSSRQLREVEAVFVDAVREFRARGVNSRPENLGRRPGTLRLATRSIKARLSRGFRS